jgi:hypothetical protein
LAFGACDGFQDYLVFRFDPGSPFRTTVRAIYPHFAQFLAGAAPLLEDFARACLV